MQKKWTIVLVLGVALAYRIILLAQDAIPLNADEAVVGLMARHIVQGRWPTFFYGQAYMGSLDATLVALGFALFRQGALIIRIVQTLLYLLTILTTIILGSRVFKSEVVGIVAGLLLAIPPMNVTLYTTVSLGGYGEAMLIGNLVLLLSLEIARSHQRRWLFLAWGFLSGLGVWAFGLSLIYSIPAGIFIVWELRRKQSWSTWKGDVLLILSGGILGTAPIFLWARENSVPLLLQELAGSAIGSPSLSTFLHEIGERVRNLILFGPSVTWGFRAPWDVEFLAKPLIPIVVVFWIFVLARIVHRLRHRDKNRSSYWLLTGVMLTLLIGFLLTPFGGDPSGRYFLPLYPILAIFAGDFIVSLSNTRLGPYPAFLLLLIVLVFHAWGTFEKTVNKPPGLTTQFDASTRIDHYFDDDLITFLTNQDELTGYSNYWVTYPIAFHSDEKIIYTPLLPYHLDLRYTSRDNRYDPYNDIVDSSETVAYITLTNQIALNKIMRETFLEKGMSWKEEIIGNYLVYYSLSYPLRPAEVGDIWPWQGYAFE